MVIDEQLLNLVSARKHETTNPWINGYEISKSLMAVCELSVCATKKTKRCMMLEGRQDRRPHRG